VNLQGRNVVVTGASQGIGERLAHEFTTAGAHVLVAARSEDRLAAIARSHNGSFITVDLTDPVQVDGFVQQCLDRLGHIDVWVNNAGVDTSAAFTELDHATIRNVVRLNVEATMILTRDVARHMLRRGSGHIVQVSSVAGWCHFQDSPPTPVRRQRSPTSLSHCASNSPGHRSGSRWSRPVLPLQRCGPEWKAGRMVLASRHSGDFAGWHFCPPWIPTRWPVPLCVRFRRIGPICGYRVAMGCFTHWHICRGA
jgi:NAD(P)-dependent dehydrogenase (short-subunit alcohol dehydrogenase family)